MGLCAGLPFLLFLLAAGHLGLAAATPVRLQPQTIGAIASFGGFEVYSYDDAYEFDPMMPLVLLVIGASAAILVMVLMSYQPLRDPETHPLHHPAPKRMSFLKVSGRVRPPTPAALEEMVGGPPLGVIDEHAEYCYNVSAAATRLNTGSRRSSK
ncbi:uncharacterized protein EHS24_001876 [Apiotrichum porosum]|uniref:Uncharacterized protein n=1 Tax=Apiotrichum porosum TaxID=105984 RepID=A0A427XJJ0_9TREE|nr:uncharacterized protein EHS24_001876 [Apiotrichum porosum]RSH78953.1 hypothetical protein EHS24_001876 [Apiotrichum porosum]